MTSGGLHGLYTKVVPQYQGIFKGFFTGGAFEKRILQINKESTD